MTVDAAAREIVIQAVLEADSDDVWWLRTRRSGWGRRRVELIAPMHVYTLGELPIADALELVGVFVHAAFRRGLVPLVRGDVRVERHGRREYTKCWNEASSTLD